MKWRIYYDDGSTFDSAMGSEMEAPGLGVICIVQPEPRAGREIMQRWDWYYWHDGEQQWWGSDIFGLLYQLCADRKNIIRAIKQGAMVSNESFQRITKRASNDPDFPWKAAPSGKEKPLVHR